jgi:hypothetical protein
VEGNFSLDVFNCGVAALIPPLWMHSAFFLLLLRIRATPGLKNAEHRRIRATPGLKNAEHRRIQPFGLD